MSIVAWDGKTLAADCAGLDNGVRRRMSKIRRLDDNTIVAWVGQQDTGLLLCEWFRNGADPDRWPSGQSHNDHWSVLIVAQGGKVFTYCQYPARIDIQEDYWAWGSGRDFALAALAMGADARRAVEIAEKFQVDCDYGVEAYDIGTQISLAKAGD